jgi:uncharacterized protein YggU (UPF0235/DUF167 family)
MARIVVTVSPGASRSELAGRHGEGWKARVAAPPERGRANDALLDLLAETLDLPRTRLTVAAGRGSRRKVVEVAGLDLDEIARRLDR